MAGIVSYNKTIDTIVCVRNLTNNSPKWVGKSQSRFGIMRIEIWGCSFDFDNSKFASTELHNILTNTTGERPRRKMLRSNFYGSRGLARHNTSLARTTASDF